MTECGNILCNSPVDPLKSGRDISTMKIIVDAERRVVLPKPAMPGDVYECTEDGARIVLVKMRTPTRPVPPVASRSANRMMLKNVDIDEPAFSPI